jgi:23S rRNA pseudouridine955/2504/2580 synthase
MLRPKYNIVCIDCHPLNSINTQRSKVDLFEVSSAQLNQRLDNFLIKQLQNVPRTRVYRIIRKGEVRVNKKRCKPDYKLQIGDIVRIPPVRIEQDDQRRTVLPSRELQKTLEAAVLYENKHILVLNKPQSLAVHAGSGVDFGVIDVMRLIRPEQEIELVHRLDRDTSGCLILAKHRQSLLAMQSLLQNNLLQKKYIAVVRGDWPQQLKEIKHPLIRYHLSNGERRMRVDPQGKSACSLISVMQKSGAYSVVQIELITGRTHQIRVHCQFEGHEIAGDNKYGDPEFNRLMRGKNVKRLMLHAKSLELPCGEFNPDLVIHAPLPQEFEILISNPK